MERKFNGVKLPPGVRKGIPQTWLFYGKSGKWVLKTKSWVISKFETKEDAEKWWLELCEHRNYPFRKPQEGLPPAKEAKRADMGPITINHTKHEKLISDATKDGYEPK